MKMLWRCSLCGFTAEGDNAPATCPKCGAPAEKFNALAVEDADKVYAANRTNDIHMKLVRYAVSMVDVCEEGLEIDLDPACHAVFENAKQMAWTIKQISKAEIATHVVKGKW
jgi:rubredoxin